MLGQNGTTHTPPRIITNDDNNMIAGSSYFAIFRESKRNTKANDVRTFFSPRVFNYIK